jgi:hypothetical protein
MWIHCRILRQTSYSTFTFVAPTTAQPSNTCFSDRVLQRGELAGESRWLARARGADLHLAAGPGTYLDVAVREHRHPRAGVVIQVDLSGLAVLRPMTAIGHADDERSLAIPVREQCDRLRARERHAREAVRLVMFGVVDRLAGEHAELQVLQLLRVGNELHYSPRNDVRYSLAQRSQPQLQLTKIGPIKHHFPPFVILLM